MRLALVGGLIAVVLLASEPAAGMRGERVRAPDKAGSNACRCHAAVARKRIDFCTERQELLQDAKKRKAKLEILLETVDARQKEALRAYINRYQEVIRKLTTGPRRIQ